MPGKQNAKPGTKTVRFSLGNGKYKDVLFSDKPASTRTRKEVIADMKKMKMSLIMIDSALEKYDAARRKEVKY